MNTRLKAIHNHLEETEDRLEETESDDDMKLETESNSASSSVHSDVDLQVSLGGTLFWVDGVTAHVCGVCVCVWCVCACVCGV